MSRAQRLQAPWSPGESPSRTQDPPSTQKGFESRKGPQKEPWCRWHLTLYLRRFSFILHISLQIQVAAKRVHRRSPGIPWCRWYLILKLFWSWSNSSRVAAKRLHRNSHVMSENDQRDISFHWLNINLWLISHPTDTFCRGITSSTRFTWGDFKLQFLQIIYPSLMWDSILIWWLTNAANAVVAQTIWRRITLILLCHEGSDQADQSDQKKN